ncbi:MAG: pantetheine-phosphate adenylyltransferase [Deltaproteobacteria bacterium]|nr:pantetheine-phosphate adenylyltransferase [Deltaproteobacteria bacterium]
MRTTAVYPGSFDPPTNGHLDIIDRSSRMFARVVVAVALNIRKNVMFSPADRVRMLRELTARWKNVEVDSFSGLLVDYARKREARVLVRGLRAISDFEYEFQMAHMNKKLAPEIDTVMLMTGEQHSYISSNIVKEIAGFGGRIDDLVPPGVRDAVFKKMKGARRK